MMTEAEMRDEIRRLAPFHHDVALPYGLRTHVPELSRRDVERTRVASLLEHAWAPLLQACGGSLRGRRVLDVACNCGGFSVEAARAGAEHVLGIDVVDRYVEQALFLKRALGLDQVEFRKMPIEELDEAGVERFDVTLCLGILYHLEDPVGQMRRIAAVTRSVILIDTTLAGGPFARRPLWRMNFLPAATAESAEASTGLWRRARVCQMQPNARAVEELLRFLGFTAVRRLRPRRAGLERRYYLGQRATFLASRADAGVEIWAGRGPVHPVRQEAGKG